MYGKFFASAFTGSMFGAGADVFAVWAYVIANTVDSQVELNPTLLAATIGATPERMEAAIAALCAPDPRSRSKECEGRRLVREGEYAYRVPTYEAYRSIRSEDDRREYNRIKKAEQRARDRAKSTAVAPPVIDLSAMSAQEEAEAEAEEVAVPDAPATTALLNGLTSLDQQSVRDFLTLLPEKKRNGWIAVLSLWKAGERLPSGTLAGLEAGEVLGMALRDYLGKKEGSAAPSEAVLARFVGTAARMMREMPSADVPAVPLAAQKDAVALAKTFSASAIVAGVFSRDRMAEPVLRSVALKIVAESCGKDAEWVRRVLGALDYAAASEERGDTLIQRVAAAIVSLSQE